MWSSGLTLFPPSRSEVKGLMYKWVITEDHVSGGDDVGVIGPHDAPDGLDPLTQRGQRFRMKDDDGVLYYEGSIVGDYSGFEPLWDFGQPNAGCTSIELQEGGNKWVVL